MKPTTRLLTLCFVLAGVLSAQDSPTSRMADTRISRMEVIGILERPPAAGRPTSSAYIKDVQTLDEQWGIVYTVNAIFRSADGGESWTQVSPALTKAESLSVVRFADRDNGYAVVKRADRLLILRTHDGGATWEREPLDLGNLAAYDASIDSGDLVLDGNGRIELSFPVTTSSNFVGSVRFASDDDGATWRFVERRVDLRTSDDPTEKRSGSWSIQTSGDCAGFKSGCVQETRVVKAGSDITPSKIVELSRAEKESARVEASPMFSALPAASTRISLNRGFDKCQAGSVAQMQLWWDNSPHYDSNLYISGRNRACPTQPFTNNPAWTNAVSAQGWGFIPTIVGYQSPCTASATTVKLSYDVAVAEAQGRGEADIAVADANGMGLPAGTVLYYDMERYDETVSTPGCRTATLAFLKGWTERVHELGYVSGVYGSPANANPDWASMTASSRMDAIWMARWDNVQSVWTYISFPTFPTDVWNNHQRIKQWQAPHNETWGGVTFNIDGNIADGPVAGALISKNRRADFDGDRKTDISVFRPDTGVWYVQKSNGTGYIILTFGLATDIPTPGDYDGDGKTDHAVFRPSDGTWHMLTKAGFYSSRAFGTNGDIPAAADFNGDGRTDLAVFRPSTGVWYISNSDSLGTYTIMQFGLNGDLPVVGDYDGDGKDDIAVWRPSTGVWYVSRSSDGGFTAVAFGISTDRPAHGDFDGDGKNDFAVLRDGTWYLLQSTAGFNQFNFGTAGDVPATGDYDGDGKDDAAVFRPSTGIWYVLQSTNGFYAQQFGVNGDKPVPSGYLP